MSASRALPATLRIACFQSSSERAYTIYVVEEEDTDA